MKACIYIALDGLKKQKALSLVKILSKSENANLIAGYKIHDLWDSYGPSIVKELKKIGAREVWVDLKLNDTPRTISLRTAAVCAAGGDVISVHASSGVRGLKAAVERKIKVATITLLTSLGEGEVKTIFSTSTNDAVLRLARLAHKSGTWAIVCSAKEVESLSKRNTFEKLKLIVPGIQRTSAKGSNQKRVGRPGKTLGSGATFIVLGTIITHDPKPLIAFENIAKEVLFR